jgi:hypothetical protein
MFVFIISYETLLKVLHYVIQYHLLLAASMKTTNDSHFLGWGEGGIYLYYLSTLSMGGIFVIYFFTIELSRVMDSTFRLRFVYSLSLIFYHFLCLKPPAMV